MIIALYTCRGLTSPVPPVEDARADRAESLCSFSLYFLPVVVPPELGVHLNA